MAELSKQAAPEGEEGRMSIGEHRSLPIIGLRGSPVLVAYLEYLPRIYALVRMTILGWAAVM